MYLPTHSWLIMLCLKLTFCERVLHVQQDVQRAIGAKRLLNGAGRGRCLDYVRAGLI
jgi:hypothetical protein